MAYDATDWDIDRATGNIRYTGDDHGGASPTYATVIEAHRAWQALADDSESVGDDEIAIYDEDPSGRSTDNIIRLLGIYNITDAESEHLYDGTISQGAGATLFRWDGIVNFGNADVQLQIHQDGAVLADDWWNEGGAGLNADATQGISHRFMLPVIQNGADIDARHLLGTARRFNETYSEFNINATAPGNNVLALKDTADLNNETAAGTVATWTGITNTNEGYVGIDVDLGGDDFFYSEWNANLPTRSINEFFERLKYLTRDGSAETLYGINGELFRGITEEIDYDGDTNGGPVELAYLAWGTSFAYDAEQAAGLSPGEYYTFGTSGAIGQLLALDDDGTTGFCVFAIQSGTGPVVDTETFVRSDGTATDGADVNDASPVIEVGGWGLVLADDAVSKVWLQILKGRPPVNDVVMYETTSGHVHDTATDGTAIVNVTVTPRPVSTPFNGASTGSAMIGAYGLGVETNDLKATDKVFDLTNVLVTPPNNVTFSVNGVATSSEDQVLVAPWDGSSTDNEGNPAIDTDQLTLNTDLLGGTETAVVVTAAIPTDTPAAGNIRIQLDDGNYRKQAYTSYTGSTFTIPSTSYTGANNASQPRNVWIGYVDDAATADPMTFTSVFDANRNLVVIVRDGKATPIKQFISSALLETTGGAISVIRTSDT